jgi:thiol:disulfide interchange protein
MLRAAFWLLAAIIGTQMVMTLVAGLGCFALIWQNEYRIGACEGVGNQVREVWAEALAALLALLLAAKNGKPPEPPPDDDKPPLGGP